jgi:hypothetical protein
MSIYWQIQVLRGKVNVSTFAHAPVDASGRDASSFGGSLFGGMMKGMGGSERVLGQLDLTPKVYSVCVD